MSPDPTNQPDPSHPLDTPRLSGPEKSRLSAAPGGGKAHEPPLAGAPPIRPARIGRRSASARSHRCQDLDHPAARDCWRWARQTRPKAIASRVDGWRRPHRRQRCARGAVRHRPSAARAAHGPRPDRPARRSRHRHRPGLSAARPPDRLPGQDQLLRRLGPAAVGAVHLRHGRVRHECHRDDPAPLR